MNESGRIPEPCTVTIDRKEWRELLKLAGRQIDPAKAEVIWWWADLADPYGIGEAPAECIGRIYFARNPDSNVWIEFNDLPDAIRIALENKTPLGIADSSTTFLEATPEEPILDRSPRASLK